MILVIAVRDLPITEPSVIGPFRDVNEARAWIVANAGLPEYRSALFKIEKTQ